MGCDGECLVALALALTLRWNGGLEQSSCGMRDGGLAVCGRVHTYIHLNRSYYRNFGYNKSPYL